MNTSRRILIFIAGLVLLFGAFSGGMVAGWFLPGSPASLLAIGTATPEVGGGSTGTPQPGSTSELFSPFWEAWDIVHTQFVDQPVDDVALMQGAISGMLSALGDKHTAYMTQEEYDSSTAMLAGEEYEGIGAWVDTGGEYLIIISPMPGSPAQRAGLRSGDQVIAVDDVDVSGMDGELVLQRIKGPAGTDVKLTIQRGEGEDAQILDFVVRRARITTPSVEGYMLDDHIAYLAIFYFGENTKTEIQANLEALLAENPVGLVLDLRNDGGGYLSAAIDVLSQFLPADEVAAFEVSGDGSRITYRTTGGGLATQIPMVVLVNEGTASASEITAGAIQDYGRGLLVGVTTFGKGSVQYWLPLQNEQGAVRITIARWLTPNERQINEVGLAPDVNVEITDADILAGKDPQLERAIQILLDQ